MFPPRCSLFIEIAHLLSQQQHHLLEVALEKLFAMPQHYLVFCCERKFQSGSVLHQLFSTIQVLCFWSTWFCKIELWHRSLKVLLAKAGNNVCIQWIESNKQFINQLWTKKALCFCHREACFNQKAYAFDSLSILRKQITGKQCILLGWRSDYQPINNMRAHGVLESLLHKATSKPEACIPPCIIQLNTVQALQCFLTKIAEMAM